MANSPEGTVRDILAKRVGIGDNTLQRAIKIMEDAIDYSFNINFARRNLNVYQKAEWVYKAEYAKTKRKLGGDRKSGSAGDSLGDTKDILAGKESFQVY